MTSFTPGPWRVGKKYTTDVYAGNMQGIRVAACFDGGDANAAHIVRCVNSHAELLEALQGVQTMANCGQLDEFIGEPWLKAVTAAIAKATS